MNGDNLKTSQEDNAGKPAERCGGCATAENGISKLQKSTNLPTVDNTLSQSQGTDMAEHKPVVSITVPALTQVKKSEKREDADRSLDRLITNNNSFAENDEQTLEPIHIGNKTITGLSKIKEPGTSAFANRKKKKRQNFKIKVAVAVFFIIIIIGCSVIWHFYHKSLLEIDIGRIRFIQKSRLLLVENNNGIAILSGKLGVSIPKHLLPFDCAGEKNIGKYICLNYKGYAILRIQYNSSEDARCYNIYWENQSDSLNPMDCLQISNAVWYGGGTGHVQPLWPVNGQSFDSTPHISGDVFGGILHRYWLSSEGVSINVDQEVPLYVSMNSYKAGHMCFKSKYGNGIYYRNETTLRPTLKYTICVSKHIREMHSYSSGKYFQSSVEKPNLKYMGMPVWSPKPSINTVLSQDYLLHLARNITEYGMQGGLFLMPSMWESNFGDLAFDPEKYTNVEEMMKGLQEHFAVALQIHPYVSIDSDIFQEAAYLKYLTIDIINNGPAVTEYRGRYVGVIDVTNLAASEWFIQRIQNLTKSLNISLLSLSGGKSGKLPRHEMLSGALNYTNPDIFSNKYVEQLMEHLPAGVMFSAVASNTQAYSTTVTLSALKPEWGEGGLQSVIPSVLTASLLGYHYVHIGAIGGHSYDVTMDEELYIRWMQLSAFLSYMEFSVPPWYYSEDTVNISKTFIDIHREEIVPVFKVFSDVTIKTGAPIHRPLWWLNPDDETAFNIDDEFLIGNKYLVAPILRQGQRSRDIYLPNGVWRDSITGDTLAGGRWVRNYKVPLNSSAYFTYVDEYVHNKYNNF